MNVEALLCDIVEDERKRKIKMDKNFDFIDEIYVNEEEKEKGNKKLRKFSLKGLSFVEYEKQLLKAQNIINELRKLSKEKQQVPFC